MGSKVLVRFIKKVENKILMVLPLVVLSLVVGDKQNILKDVQIVDKEMSALVKNIHSDKLAKHLAAI